MNVENKLNLINTIKCHESEIWYAFWSNKNNYLVTCSSDTTSKIYEFYNDYKEYRLITTLESTHSKSIRYGSFTKDDYILALASFDGEISIYINKDGVFDILTSLEGHENEVKCVEFHHEKNLLASCSRDKTIWIWEYDEDYDFQCYSILNGHSQDIKNIFWIHDLNKLVSSSYDDTIKIWTQEDDEYVLESTLVGHTSTVWRVISSPKGEALFSCSDDKSVIIWKYNLDKEKYYKSMTLENIHENSILYIDLNFNKKTIFTASADESINIIKFDLENENFKIIENLQSHELEINSIKICPLNNNILASSCDDGSIKIWNYNY